MKPCKSEWVWFRWLCLEPTVPWISSRFQESRKLNDPSCTLGILIVCANGFIESSEFFLRVRGEIMRSLMFCLVVLPFVISCSGSSETNQAGNRPKNLFATANRIRSESSKRNLCLGKLPRSLFKTQRAQSWCLYRFQSLNPFQNQFVIEWTPSVLHVVKRRKETSKDPIPQI